ncbi:MAG: hypothetical protein HUU35_09260, partial [Armatimonadetes bacterium]|nr:hypothetical protein [Armatimonadota bacterium]
MARHEPFRRWALPVAAVIAALPAVAPAFTVAWWLNHDDVSYLIRLEQFASGWRDGGYPRWCPGLASGKGYPLFEFYPPGLFSLALALDRLVTDQLLALKLSLLLLTFGGGLGAGLLARRLTESLAASVAATAVFTWAPYRLCLLYERGALAEYAGLSLLPWLLLAAELLGQAV